MDTRGTDEPVMTLVEWERWALHKLALNQFSRDQIAAADQHCKRLGELLGAPQFAVDNNPEPVREQATEAELSPVARRLPPETEAGHPTTRRGSPPS